jgi:hypothetical protein
MKAKHLVKILEAYNMGRCEDLSGIEKELCNWFFNERSISWNVDKIKQAKEKFGNVNVGLIYRGAKINSKEELVQYKKVENGGSFKFDDVVSCSDSEFEAKSFAWYVKSYDELTMLRALVTAMKRGSSGTHGSVLLELLPTKDQVIVKTYTSGQEEKDNSNWQPPPSGSAENEILITGNVKVKRAKIFEPLTKEGWQEVLNKSINTVQDLQNDFVTRWIRETKIPVIDIKTFVDQLLPRIIKSEDDVAQFLSVEDVFFDRTSYSDYGPISDFIAKYFVVRDDFTGVEYKGKSLFNVDPIKFSQLLDKMMTKSFASLMGKRLKGVKLVISGHKLHPFHLSIEPYDRFDEVYSVVTLFVRSRKFRKYVSSQTDYKKFVKSLDVIVKELLKINPDYIEKHNFSGYDLSSALYDFGRWIKIHPKQKQLRKTIAQYLYKNIAPQGPVDDKLKKAIDVMKDSVGAILKFGISENLGNPAIRVIGKLNEGI